MTDFDTKAGLIHRGLGVVARWPQVLLVIPSDSSHDVAVDEMFDQLGPQPDAEQVYDAVTRRLREPQVLRSVAILISRPAGTEALLYGAVEVVVDGAIVANGSRGISSSSLPRDVDRITVRTSNLSKAAEPVAPFDLRQGIAPGGGLTLVSVAASAAAAAAKPVEAASSAPSPFVASNNGPEAAPTSASQPEPSPALSGSSGSGPFGQAPSPTPFGGAPSATDTVHSSEPQSAPNAFADPARTAGPGPAAPAAPAASGPPAGAGPKQPIGYLVFDDNSSYTVDRSYIVGRDPSVQPGQDMQRLKIPTDAKTLSRNHAEIKLVDNSVQIVDLESTNGTFMWDKTFERWNQLAPHQTVTIRPGDSIALGRRTFVFEESAPT